VIRDLLPRGVALVVDGSLAQRGALDPAAQASVSRAAKVRTPFQEWDRAPVGVCSVQGGIYQEKGGRTVRTS